LTTTEGGIEVTFFEADRGQVRIGIDAPELLKVMCDELLEDD
jgi:sRNA-binding carbon storage regulator CsrA